MGFVKKPEYFQASGLGCVKIPACLNSEPGQSAFGLFFIHEIFC